MTYRCGTRSVALAVLSLGIAGPAGAVTNTVVLTDPSGFSNGDEVPALTAAGGTRSSGSWQADPSLTGTDGKQHLIFVQGDQPGPLEPGGGIDYPPGGPNPALLFPSTETVTLDQLVSVSFDTDTAPGEEDWFLDLFTVTGTGAGDAPDGSFFQTNLDFTTDNLASENLGNGFFRYSFSADGGAVNRDPSDRQKGDEGAGPFDFGQLKQTFGEEEILFAALGTATNYDGFGGRVDNLVFTYETETGLHTTTVDFEQAPAAVPLPGALPLLAGALAIGGLAARRRG